MCNKNGDVLHKIISSECPSLPWFDFTFQNYSLARVSGCAAYFLSIPSDPAVASNVLAIRIVFLAGAIEALARVVS